MKKSIPFLWLFITILAVMLSVGAYSVTQNEPKYFLSKSPEIDSPGNWISQDQINVFNDRVVIDLKDATWARFTNTNSMDPIIDEESHAIEILPEDQNQIKVGDIISYKTEYGTIIHRIIEKGEDKQGTYYRVKGDNNNSKDPFKIRYDDIKGVVVAVIY